MVCSLQQYLLSRVMLDKYECFFKQSRIMDCSIFTAFNRILAHGVLVKKVSNSLTWNEVLCHKQLQLCSKLKSIPKMHQILRHKGSFMFIYQQPHGNSLAPTQPVDKQEVASVLQMMNQLLQTIQELDQAVPGLIIVPEWVYCHRNNLRLVHYEPFLAKQQVEQRHIFTHNENSQAVLDEQPEASEADVIPEKYRKALVFHLGMIAFRLFTGKKEQVVRNREQYEEYVKGVRDSCQRMMNKVDLNHKLVTFVTNMLSSNKFDVPTLVQVCNFFANQKYKQHSHKVNKQLKMQIQIQKINLSNNRLSTQPHRRPKICCQREESLTAKRKSQTKKLAIASKKLMAAGKPSQLMLPYLSLKNSQPFQRTRNHTCVNRHNLYASPTGRNKSREYFKSFAYFQKEAQLS